MLNTGSASNGITFFHSKLEMRNGLPCKLYKLDENNLGIQKDHAHDYIQIWYVKQGKFKHCINNKQYMMVAGNLFVIPPFAVHRVEWLPGPVEILGCEFLPGFINDRYGQMPFDKDFFDFAYLEKFLTTEDKVTPKITLTGIVGHKVDHIFEEMLEEYVERESYYELVLKGNLLKLLSIIIREFQEDAVREMGDKIDKYRPLIKVAIDYIHEHYKEEIRLDYMCKITMLSKTYFSDLFKYFTKKTFTDYVFELRMEHSAELLAQSNMTVTEICYEVGFNDLTYFSRIFKKHMGLSPSQYKKYVKKSG